MPLDFPNSPTNGDTYTANSKTWSFNGTSWELLQSDSLVSPQGITETRIADGAVSEAKLASNAVTTAKIAANAISSSKLASNLSAVTITTSSTRTADIPSPFTGQIAFETDTMRLKVWSGSSWLTISASPPEPPTSLSAAQSNTSVAISFTPGADNGSAITNYQYALSTNGGSSYGSYTAISPADAVSPITISGLTQNTTYFVKLKAVNSVDAGVNESSALSFTTHGTPTSAPTSLSATPSTTTVSISFTDPVSNGGSAITNYQYALSTNGGSSYGAYSALSPADATSPITISGLTVSTTYFVKLRAVNTYGAGVESSAISFTTIAAPVVATGGTITDITISGVPYKLHTFTSSGTFSVSAGGNVQYYLVGGGFGPGADSTGGGSGGTATGTASTSATSYSVQVGGGGSVGGNNGTTSFVAFSGTPTAAASNTFTSGNGFAPGSGYGSTFSNSLAGGGGGAAQVGGNATSNTQPGNGGNGVDVSTWIGQSAGTTYKGGGGGGMAYHNIDWGNPGPGNSTGGLGGGGAGGRTVTSGTANSGGGGGSRGGTQGGAGQGAGSNGGSGIVYIRYPRDFGL